jgi:hypothetical protein
LKAAGYEWTAVLLKPNDLVTKSAVEFKAGRRKLVEQGTSSCPEPGVNRPAPMV